MDAAASSHRVGPTVYLLAGVGLFGVKFVVDRLVAGAFGRDWSFLNYLIPNETYALPALPPGERGFYLVMLGVALPFAACGLVLTWQRLRDAGLPRWLVTLFFVPAANLVFFTVLGFWPSRQRPADATDGEVQQAQAIPTADGSSHAESTRSFVAGAFAGAAIAAAIVVIGVVVFRDYGWGAFVGAPFAGGMTSAWVNGMREPRTGGESAAVATVSLLICGVILLVIAFEGIVCLVMAAPLAFLVTMLGALLGHHLQLDRHRRRRKVRGFQVLPAICLPLAMMGGESAAPAVVPVHQVTTSVVVDAPTHVVWQHVVSFPDLPPPRDLLFSSGIAYPVRARIEGIGVGAMRYCEFSTGAFVEPITLWQEPSRSDPSGLLRFDVTHNPPPLREWSWTDAHPPHLEGFLESRRGEFKLTPLPGGRTLLQGTTWYRHTIWPDAYWRLWSDHIIGRIHHQVLHHVARLAESEIAGLSAMLSPCCNLDRFVGFSPSLCSSSPPPPPPKRRK